MNVDILGKEYEVVEDNEWLLGENADGIAQFYSKRILVRPEQKMLGAHEPYAARSKRFKEVMRHEVIHAMLYESGHDEESYDERIVQWIAVMYPKMSEIFAKLGCLS